MYICRSTIKSNRLTLPTVHHRCKTPAQMKMFMSNPEEKEWLEGIAAQWTRLHPKYTYMVVEEVHGT